uniref:periodic tryptophan protein 1 homolog n=1 Tax=Ciona intestinalis TaxID=7719 RepID=UPI000180BDE4|nr:periodic tryptophan protein 1 homolog [Ciona intestinalis]|eukprot:XP_002128920.1 periodic tryptophan protein 1 homolog [Ciona intestinalis]
MDIDDDEIKGSSQIFCMTWVPKKAAKKVPDRILLSTDELKSVLNVKNQNEEDSESSDDEDVIDDDVTDDDVTNDDVRNDDVTNDDVTNNDITDDDDLKEFDMDNYDDENDTLQDGGISSLVVFPTNEDDPYITKNINEDSEDEKEEMEALNICDDDNLLINARCEADYNSLEIHVYNKKTQDFYVHHDVPLSGAPLCMEWLDFDPGNLEDEKTNDKGNFVAVGNINSLIEVWDLDVLNTLEPAFVLGVPQEHHRKLLRSGESNFGHTDAVLDISWNSKSRNKLLSASADHMVALWNLEVGKVEKFFTSHKEKVQCLSWKPDSTNYLVSGAFDGRVVINDVRGQGSSKWKFKGEIERVVWNVTDPSYFAASTDSGMVYYCDVRVPKSLFHWRAHEKAIPSMLMTSSALTSSLLYTASSDGRLKMWDLKGNIPKLIYERNMKMGMVHCMERNPDVLTTFGLGGEKGGIRLWSPSSVFELSEHFPNAENVVATSDAPMAEDDLVMLNSAPDVLDVAGIGKSTEVDVRVTRMPRLKKKILSESNLNGNQKLKIKKSLKNLSISGENLMESDNTGVVGSECANKKQRMVENCSQIISQTVDTNETADPTVVNDSSNVKDAQTKRVKSGSAKRRQRRKKTHTRKTALSGN